MTSSISEEPLGSQRFVGQLAVVTGGASGIGEAICERLAIQGAEVIVADVDFDAAAEVAGRIGGEPLALNVTDFERVAALLGPDAFSGRPVSVLINNAGLDHFEWFTDVSPESWRQLLAVNLEGVFACTQAVLPGMQLARYGRLLSVSSEAGRIGSKGNAVYAAAKAGIIGFMKSIARENARYSITSNSIAPGPVRTGLVDSILATGPQGDRMISSMISGTQLGRLGTVEEIAAVAAFMVSQEASYVTGETFGVSGGMGLGA